MESTSYIPMPYIGGSDAEVINVVSRDSSPVVGPRAERPPPLGAVFGGVGAVFGFILGAIAHAAGLELVVNGWQKVGFARWAGPIVIIFLATFVVTLLAFSAFTPCRPRLDVNSDVRGTPPTTHEIPAAGDARYEAAEYECDQNYNNMACCISLLTAAALIIGAALGSAIASLAGWFAFIVIFCIIFVALVLWYLTVLMNTSKSEVLFEWLSSSRWWPGWQSWTWSNTSAGSRC